MESSGTPTTKTNYLQIFDHCDVSKRKTKIIGTIGTGGASNDVDLLLRLLDNGMDVARFDFSSGD